MDRMSLSMPNALGDKVTPGSELLVYTGNTQEETVYRGKKQSVSSKVRVRECGNELTCSLPPFFCVARSVASDRTFIKKCLLNFNDNKMIFKNPRFR